MTTGVEAMVAEQSARRELTNDWLRRHVQIALGCGLGLGALGQLLVAVLAPGELDARAGERIAGVLYSAAGWLVCALLLALATQKLLGSPRGRRVALAAGVVVLGGLAFVQVLGVALRIVSGSYLTLGAVQFTVNSSDHFMHAAVGGYSGWAMACVAALGGCGAFVHRLLRPVAHPQPQPSWRPFAASLVLVTTLAAVYWQREDSRFTRRMFVSSPLLALVSSLRYDYELDRSKAQPEAIGEPLAPDGPPRSAEAMWRERVDAVTGERPNVLLVLLESIALEHMSLAGYHRPTTPEIDRLAREGLWMTRAWTTATHSNYAQMAVLSSLFPRRVHGLDQYERLDYPRFLFHDFFALLGYDTATISSQDEDWQGMRRFQATGTDTFFWYSADYTGQHLDSGVEKTVPDEDTTAVALDWLSGRRDRPWALYLNLQATHFPYSIAPGNPRPYQPDEPTWSTFSYLRYPRSERDVVINRYDNALRHVDAQLGRIRRHLEATGQLDRTLIVITADHGELFFDRGLVTHGRTLYDVESRVPLILRWPGRVPAEQRDEPVSNLDVMPTVADLLELPPHPSWQGTSFATPRPGDVGKRAIYLNIQGLRFADAIVCWPYKLLVDRTAGEPHLYHLERDPAEMEDLIDLEPDVGEQLHRTLSSQLIAQLDYHRVQALSIRDERFQPRLRKCPAFAIGND